MSEPKHFSIEWLDAGREPQGQPNEKWPAGIDLDMSLGRTPACKAELPYPAKRCGVYSVVCRLCGSTGGCTTAGRADDPASITLACKPPVETEGGIH